MLSTHNIGYIFYVITGCGKSHLCNVLQQIVDPHVLPNLQSKYSCKTPHAARLTTAHPNNHNFHTLPWPTKSPDFNPIEHLWDVLDQNIKKRPNKPRTLAKHSLDML